MDDTTLQHRGFTIHARALGVGRPYAGSYEARPRDLLAEGHHLAGETEAKFDSTQAAVAAAADAGRAAIDGMLGKV